MKPNRFSERVIRAIPWISTILIIEIVILVIMNSLLRNLLSDYTQSRLKYSRYRESYYVKTITTFDIEQENKITGLEKKFHYRHPSNPEIAAAKFAIIGSKIDKPVMYSEKNNQGIENLKSLFQTLQLQWEDSLIEVKRGRFHEIQVVKYGFKSIIMYDVYRATQRFNSRYPETNVTGHLKEILSTVPEQDRVAAYRTFWEAFYRVNGEGVVEYLQQVERFHNKRLAVAKSWKGFFLFRITHKNAYSYNNEFLVIWTITVIGTNLLLLLFSYFFGALNQALQKVFPQYLRQHTIERSV